MRIILRYLFLVWFFNVLLFVSICYIEKVFDIWVLVYLFISNLGLLLFSFNELDYYNTEEK